MRPIAFTVENGITYFQYDQKELERFNELGKRNGNVGMILVSRQGTILTYKGYGTIEKPHREEMIMSIKHHPVFDGDMPSDEQRISVEVPVKSRSYKFVMLDFSGENTAQIRRNS